MAYFPMFIELKHRKCLVVGGGQVAFRKAETLKDFGADVSVVAPNILPQIWAMDGVFCLEKMFEEEDAAGFTFIVAATDDQKLNRHISQICRKRNIPVNAVDQIEDCSFIFPSYVKEGEVVAAFSSGGLSPVTTQYLKEQIRPVLTPHLGEVAACLGSLREMVRACTQTEEQRKQIYRELLQIGLSQESLPSEEEITEVIYKYQK